MAEPAKARLVETVARFRFDPGPEGRWLLSVEHVEYFLGAGGYAPGEHVWASYQLGTVSDRRKRQMEGNQWQ